MPTGYTCAVVDGKITEFPKFALSCARAFGALIHMREDAMDAPLPDAIEPQTSYYQQSKDKHQARLIELSHLSPAHADAEARTAYNDAIASRNKYLEGKRIETERLTAMLRKVHEWVPPTPDHVRMKEFMIEQLTISMPGDYAPSEPVRLDGQTWLQQEIQSEKAALAYAEKQIAEEVERAAGRDKWLQDLRASLAAQSSYSVSLKQGE